MTDKRSERLRRRRKRSKERRNDTSDAQGSAQGGDDTTSKPSEPSKTEPDTTEPDATELESDQEIMPIKEEQVGTYMYLPETQTMELRRLYNVLKAEYEFKYEEEFEKNRHFYPLVVQYGLDNLEGLDASEIRERLGSIQ